LTTFIIYQIESGLVPTIQELRKSMEELETEAATTAETLVRLGKEVEQGRSAEDRTKTALEALEAELREKRAALAAATDSTEQSEAALEATHGERVRHLVASVDGIEAELRRCEAGNGEVQGLLVCELGLGFGV